MDGSSGGDRSGLTVRSCRHMPTMMVVCGITIGMEKQGRWKMKQFSIFDMDIDTDPRPCRYNFCRYVGQKVKTKYGICTITRINGPYYTDIRSKKGELLVGTPYDIWPVEDDE